MITNDGTRCRIQDAGCMMQDKPVLKEKQISSFGKAFLSKKRFVKICVICG